MVSQQLPFLNRPEAGGSGSIGITSVRLYRVEHDWSIELNLQPTVVVQVDEGHFEGVGNGPATFLAFGGLKSVVNKEYECGTAHRKVGVHRNFVTVILVADQSSAVTGTVSSVSSSNGNKFAHQDTGTQIRGKLLVAVVGAKHPPFASKGKLLAEKLNLLGHYSGGGYRGNRGMSRKGKSRTRNAFPAEEKNVLCCHSTEHSWHESGAGSLNAVKNRIGQLVSSNAHRCGKHEQLVRHTELNTVRRGRKRKL
mmetsp:Transcript_48906/g.97573  ORF Transcript_48906/g.97573 Transcript_48906/m.97573 type:complete len:252 (+) Transcript_48906:790-1545(+)